MVTVPNSAKRSWGRGRQRGPGGGDEAGAEDAAGMTPRRSGRGGEKVGPANRLR